MTTDYAHLADIAAQAIEIGAKRFPDQAVTVVTSKVDKKDPVSDVDLAIENDVRAFLANESPEIDFVGEETGGEPSGLWWCLDPIDGTANYIRGSSLCGISLALIEGNKPVVGVISLPRLGEVYQASLGNGTTLNGEPITTPEVTDLSQAVVAFGDFAFGDQADELNEIRIEIMAMLSKEAMRIRMLGSAAVDLAWLASGSMNGSITLINNPWDMAAGALVVQEAGATIIDERGRRYTTDSRSVFGACSQTIVDQLRAIYLDSTA